MNIHRSLAAGLLLAIAVSASTHARPKCDEPFVEVLTEWQSHIAFEQFRVIDNEAEWCGLWDTVYKFYFPPRPCDTTLIDFGREVAIVAAIGGRSNTCYGVDITCVRRLGNSRNIHVEVVERQPSLDCVCLAAVVSPLEVIKVARPVRHASFKKQIETLNCHGAR